MCFHANGEHEGRIYLEIEFCLPLSIDTVEGGKTGPRELKKTAGLWDEGKAKATPAAHDHRGLIISKSSTDPRRTQP